MFCMNAGVNCYAHCAKLWWNTNVNFSTTKHTWTGWNVGQQTRQINVTEAVASRSFASAERIKVSYIKTSMVHSNVCVVMEVCCMLLVFDFLWLKYMKKNCNWLCTVHLLPVSLQKNPPKTLQHEFFLRKAALKWGILGWNKNPRGTVIFISWFLRNLCFCHITAAPYAEPIISLPVQSASLLSQQAAQCLLQLHPPSVICTSTRMRPAWVICVKIRQIKKYNGQESGLFSWLLNTVVPKAMLFLYPIVVCG